MITGILIGVVILFILYSLVPKRPQGLPPGEWGYPIIGYIPALDRPFMKYIEDYQKKFGDIFHWKMGQRTFIFLCNYKLIKTAFNGPFMVDRPNFYTLTTFALGKDLGIKSNSGPQWSNTRKFTLRYLRDKGMGKSSLLPDIETEVRYLVEEFKKSTNQPTEIPWSLNVAILNVTWKMVADRRYNVADKEVQKFLKVITELLDAFQGNVVLIDLVPWLDKVLPIFFRRWLGIQKYKDSVDKMYDYLKDVVRESAVDKSPFRPQTFIDLYLEEMAKGDTSQYAGTFSENDLLATLGDLFSAGSETTSSTIRWILLYLTKYPHIQRKVQEEIDTVVPNDKHPSLDDRERLPYTNAVFHEVMRLMPLLPLNFYHSASENTSIGGYTIPKGAVIIGSIMSCHQDPDIWERPKEFYPEHFLQPDGSFVGKKDGFMPFSIGRRVCIGESLARTQIYLTTSALVQNFEFLPTKEEELSLEVDPKQPLFNLPIKFRLIFRERIK